MYYVIHKYILCFNILQSLNHFVRNLSVTTKYPYLCDTHEFMNIEYARICNRFRGRELICRECARMLINQIELVPISQSSNILVPAGKLNFERNNIPLNWVPREVATTIYLRTRAFKIFYK